MEDGSRVLNEDQGFVTRGSKDRVLLERGGLLLAESDIYSFPVGFAVNIGERILLEDDHDDHTVSFSEIGDISFNELLRKEKTIIEQDENTRDIVEGIRLENESGRILLNGTDISSTDAGDKVSLEPFLKSDRSSSGA